MFRFSILIPLCSILILTQVSADILWDTCVGRADHPSIVKGNFFNLCIRDHIFKDKEFSWTFTKTDVADTLFDSCKFDNTREKTNNFTEAIWTNVEFKSCRFGSFTEQPMKFDKTAMTNVRFTGCTFHSSVDLVFSEFLFNNVTFENCIFESNAYFELGQANGLNFLSSDFKRSEHATTPSGTDSITFRFVTIRGMSVEDSEFITPLRLEGVSGADLAFNNTSFNEFHCHSPPEDPGSTSPKIKYLSAFNDTAFQKVTFHEKITCDRTKWLGFFMGNVTFYSDADFSDSNVLDLYWDEVKSGSIDGSCKELDFSNSYIRREVLANTSIECKAIFDGTVFETVYVKNFRGTRPSFVGAEFREQEFVDGHCCTRACRPLKCLCNVSEPSQECPRGGSDVNVRAPQSCFPGDATVKRHDGLLVRMEDLAISEKVAIGGGEYSDVFFFGHRSADKESEFVSIRHAAATRALRLSPEHYLYVNGGLRTAKMVKAGDRLRGVDGQDNLFVMEVRRETGRGLYAPTSMHGDILVEGVVVSSYTSAVHPGVAHKLLHPVRLLYRYGFDSIVSRMTLLHERSLSGFSAAIGIPRGPDVVEE